MSVQQTVVRQCVSQGQGQGLAIAPPSMPSINHSGVRDPGTLAEKTINRKFTCPHEFWGDMEAMARCRVLAEAVIQCTLRWCQVLPIGLWSGPRVGLRSCSCTLDWPIDGRRAHRCTLGEAVGARPEALLEHDHLFPHADGTKARPAAAPDARWHTLACALFDFLALVASEQAAQALAVTITLAVSKHSRYVLKVV